MRREGLRLGQRLIDLRLEGAGIKLKEQLPFADDLAVLETDFLNVAAHPGPNFDFFRRPQPARVRIFVRHAHERGVIDGDFRWLGLGGRRRFVAATPGRGGQRGQ